MTRRASNPTLLKWDSLILVTSLRERCLYSRCMTMKTVRIHRQRRRHSFCCSIVWSHIPQLLLGVVVDRGFKPLTLDLIKVRASTMPGADKVEELYLSMH